MNTQATLEIETPTPLKEITLADRPRYDVPIMIEITKQDLDQAEIYTSCDNCLIATALKRYGYEVQSVNPSGVTFGEYPNNTFFGSDEISSKSLESDAVEHIYRKDLVGKQIILYPKNT